MNETAATAARALRGALLCSVAMFGMTATGGWAQAAGASTATTAQTNSPDTPTPGNTSQTAADAAASDAGQIGDVVVTAQRRTERLQLVPLSVVALSAAEIRNQDISDVSRLVQVIPGLRLGRSGAAERPAIRGVYTEAIGLNSDPRIGFYIDEVYQSRPQQTTASLVDLERVEVQKGPQGTLFGRNSYGGNIAFSTAKPTDHVEGGVDALYGNYDRIRIEGFFNTPLADGLALRVAGAFERHDGYLQSVVNSRADLQDKHEYFVRGSLRWAPTALDGRLEVLLRGSYFRRNDHGFNSINGKVIGVAVDPTLVTAPGSTLVYNGQSFTFPLAGNGTGGFNGLSPGTGTLYPYTNAFRDGVADVNGADVGIRLPGAYRSVYDAAPTEDLRQQQYSGTISYEISPAVRVRSITSYTNFRTVNGGDGDGGPIPLQYYISGTRSRTFTQELQLQSADASSPLQYTLGGFYLNETARDATSYYYLNRTYTTASAAAQGLPVLYGGIGGYGAANGCQYSYTTPAACNLNYTTGNIFDSRGETAAKTKSYAIYGQASYTIDGRLTLTAGARYTVDDKDYRSVFQSSNNGTSFAGQYATAQGFANPGNYYAVNPYFSDDFANLTCGGFTAQPISTNQSSTPVATVPNYFYTLCGSRKFKFGTYRLALDYKLSPDNLLYASFSTGRHSGGFGAGAFAANSPGAFTTFNSEGVTAYEIGSKNQFFDRRLQLNIAAFYNHYTDLQAQGTQQVVINGATQNVTTIFNTGSENAPGAELSLIAKPTPELTINASLNYLHARYTKYPTYIPPSFICFYLTGGCQGGTTSSNAPANYGIGGGYFPNAQTNPELFVNTGISGFQYAYIPQDRRVQNTPDWSAQFGASYDIDAGSAGTFTPQFHTIWSGRYLLSPAAPNIQQESYFKSDARIAWTSADHRLSAQIFVQNIENKATLGRITVGSNGQIQGTYDDPRTYGARVGFRF
ncbi:TonB-dependent receptor [Sphingomonas sp.]|uniref:TonB-dependent receptor n=1 Tax=Sphingomonas sp. TaxID=28214 RepID=UPI003CC69042